MADRRYSISIDPSSRLVRIVLDGFWDVGTVARFKHDVTESGRGLGAAGTAPSTLRILTDARGMRTQSQDVVAALLSSFADERGAVYRSAMLVDSALFRLQLRRVTGDSHGIFNSEEEALGWLFG